MRPNVVILLLYAIFAPIILACGTPQEYLKTPLPSKRHGYVHERTPAATEMAADPENYIFIGTEDYPFQMHLTEKDLSQGYRSFLSCAECPSNLVRTLDGVLTRRPESTLKARFPRLYDAIRTLPSKLEVKRIRIGNDPEKIAIIGRSMGNVEAGLVGVRDVATHFREKNLCPEIFEPSTKSQKEFEDMIGAYRLRVSDPRARLPEEVIVNTNLFKDNQAWAKRLNDEGYTVLDIGNPNNLQTTSVFYEMEKSVLNIERFLPI